MLFLRQSYNTLLAPAELQTEAYRIAQVAVTPFPRKKIPALKGPAGPCGIPGKHIVWIPNTAQFQLHIIISLLLAPGAPSQYLYPTHNKVSELP